MSISAKLQQFRTSPRIILNDKFIGDQAANQLSNILSTHPNLQSLQLKSNDLSAQGLIPIFQALSSNSTMLKELNIEHNNLGSNDYIQWHQQLNTMIEMSKNLVYLNLSNNKISSEGFLKLCQAIVRSKSLKLVQFRYNNIGGEAVAQFAKMLKDFGNEVLLFVELAGNKVKKDVIDGIQIILNKNRAKNPITKQKLMANVSYTDHQADLNRTHNQARSTGSIPHENITIYLEQLLDQTRQDNAQTKIRLQAQLLQLQKRERQDALQLNELQKNCNELQIINRNLKFQLDRTISQHQQLQKDQQSHLRHHEQKIRQGSKQLQELELKYTEIESRMNKEHEIKMKEIVRDWESRLRAVEEKIRSVESENVGLQGQIRKGLEKRERLRLELVQEQNGVRSRVHEQQIQRFNLKVKSLQSKLRQLQTTKQGHVFRNQDLVQQLQRQNKQSSLEIEQLQKQLEDLKAKQVQFNARSKDFFAKNQKIKAQIQLKQITIDKLEEQISRLDRQVEQKSAAEEEQLAKVRENFELTRYNRQNQRSTRLQRLNQTENALRAAQLENGKLRQEYGLLAQKLQVGLSLAVHKVFEENSLYQ